jgi:hypothetical protein
MESEAHLVVESEQRKDTVRPLIYMSDVDPVLGWDVMLVRPRDPEKSSTVVARDQNGAIHRKTDYETWRLITDEAERQHFQLHFDNRDKLLAAQNHVDPSE